MRNTMLPIRKFLLSRQGGLFIVFFLILLGVGCSRPGIANSSEQTDTNNPPFHQDSRNGAGNNSEFGADSSEQGNQKASSNTLPFARSGGDLPTGTLFTVSLKSSISGSRSVVPQVFEAVIDEPVVVDGKTLVPRGTEVLGHVESARPSYLQGVEGYLSLTLDSLRLKGIDIPLQTSNLFARGNARQSFAQPEPLSARIVSLNRGRRLTFRLTSSVALTGTAEAGEHLTPSPASK
jgi:hypothetical protein